MQLQPQHASLEQLLAAARAVEALGFDTLWVWDHFFPMFGVPGAPLGESLPVDAPHRGYHFEAWTLLTAVACHTERISLGALVSACSYRNPDLLADMARTLDHVCRGRVILGLGSGWYAKDYEEYGYPLGTAASRLADLGRALPRIRRRLEVLSPPPVQERLPLLIGGVGEQVTLRLVARHADMWNGAGAPEVLAHKLSVLRRWCDKEGRDFHRIEKSVMLYRPEQLDLLEQYRRAGITHFLLGLGVPFDLAEACRVRDWVRRSA